MNEYEKMVKGRLYNAMSKDLIKPHLQGLDGCMKFNNIPYKKAKKRERLLNKLIPSTTGKNLGVFSPLYFEYGKNIIIGSECFFNYNCVFLDIALITLGDSVWLGPNVTLATPMHPLLASERTNKEYPDGYHDLEYAKPITICDNVWIASSVTICGGVTIGKDSVVCAGSVVTTDMPSGYLIGGVPAKPIRKLTEDDKIDVCNTYLKEELPLSLRDKKAKD